MTQRAFVVSFILLAVACTLSATPLGGVFGFMFATAFVFFVFMPVAMVTSSMNWNAFPLTPNQFLLVLAGLYALVVTAKAVQAWRLLERRDLNNARSAGFGAAVLLALPLIVWLSVHAVR